MASDLSISVRLLAMMQNMLNVTGLVFRSMQYDLIKYSVIIETSLQI